MPYLATSVGYVNHSFPSSGLGMHTWGVLLPGFRSGASVIWVPKPELGNQ